MKVYPHLGNVNILTYDTITPSLFKYNTMISNTKNVYTQKIQKWVHQLIITTQLKYDAIKLKYSSGI